MTLNWRTVTKLLVRLAGQKAHSLDLRGAIQVYNAALGEYAVTPLKVVLRGIPKKTDLGKLDVGSAGDASSEFEVVCMKVTLNGKTALGLV